MKTIENFNKNHEKTNAKIIYFSIILAGIVMTLFMSWLAFQITNSEAVGFGSIVLGIFGTFWFARFFKNIFFTEIENEFIL